MQQLDSPKCPLLLALYELPFAGLDEADSADAETFQRASAEVDLQDQRLGVMISNVLRYGVLIACAIVLVGGVLYLIRHGMEPVSYQVFRGEPAVFCSPAGVIQAVLEGKRRGIVQLGLLVLVATPILRVILSWLTFLIQRDRIYFTLTSLVLAGLLYSFWGAYL